MNSGIILLDKPAGITSFGVVARIRRVLTAEKKAALLAAGDIQERVKVKVGHTGTLDPFATGLMILVVGKECKNAQYYTKLDKVYEATIILGEVSTTGDPEGEVTQQSDIAPSRQEIEVVLQNFVGDTLQRPPIFSAIKIDGKRAYKLARDGAQVELPLRPIHIYSLEVVSYEYPQLKIRTHVSSGTYIRSLAVDIGEALGTGAYCSELRRTQIAEWNVTAAQTLADFGITD